MAGAVTQTERFNGFSDEAIQFFLELQAEQSRTWFKAHQADYLRLCRRPLELLVVQLQDRLSDAYPHIAGVEPHFFRIQRDTRFAGNKEPYKTNVAADLPIRPRRPGEDQHTTPGLYFSFGLDGEFVAIGAWHMTPEMLARYRVVLDDPRSGGEIKSIVDGLLGRGWELGSMESLKRVPPPYRPDHPCAELLKRKGLAMSIQPPPNLSASPAFADWAEARLREAAPMAHWLDRNLAAAALPAQERGRKA
ncbi:MAG TPA: TIGR02453 family protein [Chloroflexota bacterium]